MFYCCRNLSDVCELKQGGSLYPPTLHVQGATLETIPNKAPPHPLIHISKLASGRGSVALRVLASYRPAMKRLFCLKAKSGLGRFALSALPCCVTQINQYKKHPWYRKMLLFIYFLHPMLVRSAMKSIFCLKAKNGVGRFSPSALPQVSASEFSRIFRRDQVGKKQNLIRAKRVSNCYMQEKKN